MSARGPSNAVLERNLRLLFARAWRPVVARPEFRARVAALVDERVAHLARSVTGPATGPFAHGAARRRPRLVAALAAAAAFVGALLLVARLLAPAAQDGPAAPPDVVAVDPVRPPAAPDSPESGGADLALDVPPPPAAADGRQPVAVAVDTDDGARAAPEPELPPGPSGARLAGSVVSARSGAPVDDFAVVLLASVRLPDVAEPEPHAFADSGGAFRIDGAAPGRTTVFVVADGFAVRRIEGVDLEDGALRELAVELEEGGVVRGLVVDAGGRPVEGALVLSERDTPVQVLPLDASLMEGAVRGARTGPDGRFELAHLSSSVHLLRATAGGHGAAWSEPVDLTAGHGGAGSGRREAEVELSLGVGASLTGRVTRPDGDGGGWSGALVIASLIDYTFARPCMSFGMAFADERGRYAIADLPAGTYAVLVPSESEITRRPPTVRSVVLAAGLELVCDLPGDASGSDVRGRLVDAAGAPLGDYDLTLYVTDGEDAFRSARTDAAGRFALEGLTPGEYFVYCGRSMGIDMTLVGPLVVPAGDVDGLELVTGSAALAGRVLDGRDRGPVGEAILILERTDVQGRQRVFAGKTLTDAEGAWRFDGLAPGTYRASAYSLADSLGEERLDGLTLIERQERAGLELVLWPGAELAVRVRDAAGRPVTGARVGFEDALGREVAFGVDDRTDAYGALRVRGLRPERWTIRAVHDGRRAEASLVVRTDEPNEVVLDLR